MRFVWTTLEMAIQERASLTPSPLQTTSMPPECSATYGDGECTCTMDENFCITVDCSEFEPSAKIDTCQVVGLDGAVEAQSFMLAFGTPEEDTTTTDEETTEDIIDVDTNESSSLSNEGSAASMVQLSVIAAAALPLVSVTFFL